MAQAKPHSQPRSSTRATVAAGIGSMTIRQALTAQRALRQIGTLAASALGARASTRPRAQAAAIAQPKRKSRKPATHAT